MAETRAYTPEDLNRMQQEAMARMMEMRQEAPRQTGWSTDPNMPRQNRAPRQEQPPPPPPQTPPQKSNPQGNTGRQQSYHQQQNRRRQSAPPPRGNRQPPPPREEKRTDTTLLQDILGAVGLDDDRVLILGLILILVNAKADTTLILALCYLLL